MDFGLAKPTPLPELPDVSADCSLVGTVAYMSPEQVECRAIDARSDIFSFGVVLYEMLTGTRPFTGSSSAALISAILALEPPKVGSAQLDHIVRRCLAKDPSERWQTARDLMLELEWLGDSASHPSTPVPRSRRTHLVLAALLVLAVGVIALKFRGPPTELETRFQISPPGSSLFTSFAISPDGRAIVMATIRDGDSSLSIRRADATDTTVLDGTKGQNIHSGLSTARASASLLKAS